MDVIMRLTIGSDMQNSSPNVFHKLRYLEKIIFKIIFKFAAKGNFMLCCSCNSFSKTNGHILKMMRER